MHGVTSSGRKVIGFAAALTRDPSTLGLDMECAGVIAEVLDESGRDIGTLLTHGGVLRGGCRFVR
jgi:hypothetical protein